MKKILITLIAPILFTLPAQALFEIRAGYGIQTPADKDYQNGGGTAQIKTVSGFNLDGIVELPMVPVGLGLRYEDMSFDVANVLGAGTVDSDFNRLSLIVNYRLIDFFVYAGLIGTIGFQNDIKIEAPGIGSVEYDADMTFSVGAEAGVSLGLMTIGAELGYFSGTYENANNNDLDMSGIYAKAIVGVGF